jgi:N-acetylmuramoyl-L-alanine amidase
LIAVAAAGAGIATRIFATHDRPQARPPAAEEVPNERQVASRPAPSTTTSQKTVPVATPNERADFLAALRQRVIVIDPGHNGANASHAAEINRMVNAGTLKKPCDTTGTETASGYTEAQYNLDVGLRLARMLRAAGAHVILTRSTNRGWGPCITERAAIGNKAEADVAISIHADGGPQDGRGFHVIYPPSIAGLTDDIAPASQRLAFDVRRAFAAGTSMPYSTYIGKNGLDVRTDLGGLNLSNVPKVFIESGNMRNAHDAGLLESPSFREAEARALERGLAAFLASE